MTTQTSDILEQDGVEYRVKPYPLSDLGEGWCESRMSDGRSTSRFAFVGTMCHRRYSAGWSVVDDKLHLVRFVAKPAGELDGPRRDMMLDVFGTTSLFAFWFSGSLHSGFGDLLEGMYDPDHEFEHVWTFSHGLLTGRTVVHNTSAPVRRKNEISPNLRKFIDEL